MATKYFILKHTNAYSSLKTINGWVWINCNIWVFYPRVYQKFIPKNPFMLCSKLYSLIYQLLNHNIKLGTSKTKFFFSPMKVIKFENKKNITINVQNENVEFYFWIMKSVADIWSYEMENPRSSNFHNIYFTG